MCYSELDEGTTFKIYLPTIDSTQEGRKAEEHLTEPEGGSETILLVDDEEPIRGLGTQILEEFGYTVLTAADGESALQLYSKEQEKIDLVILDLIMPDMGGGEVFDRRRKINTQVKVLLSSGYSRDGQANEILNRGCDGFIQKPFSLKALSEKVRELLSAA